MGNFYLGDFSEDKTLYIHFLTVNQSGDPTDPNSALDADDFRIYKNGSAAQKTTTNGITVTSPFDSVTGKHLIVIDTSDDTGDADFWEAGADYRVEVNSSKTVGGNLQTGKEVATFSIENRHFDGMKVGTSYTRTNSSGDTLQETITET